VGDVAMTTLLDKRQNFSTKTKLAEWEAAGGCCRDCRAMIITADAGEYDHIVPTSVGGDASLKNCKLLCVRCHKKKTKRDRREIDKTRRILKLLAEPKKRKRIWPSRPLPGTRASGVRIRMDRTVERR
jgi:5-methylcytosine-specific restriction protein A